MNSIKTRRLSLTIVTMEDVKFLSDLFSYADVRKYYVLRDDHARNISLFVSYMVDSIQNGRSLEYIVRLHDGTPIGLAGGELCREMTGEISWNSAYAIHPTYRRNGYATEALIGFTEHIKQYNIAKSFLDISDDNENSKKVAQKAGYKFNRNTAHFDPKHEELSVLFHWEFMLHSNRNRLFSMGCQAYKSKDYRSAEQYFQQAINEDYDGGPNTDALCYSNMGMACTSYGNYTKAFQCLKKAKSLGLTNPSIERELNWLKVNKGLF